MLRVAQVGHQGLQARTVPHRPGHARGEGRPRPGSATGAAHGMRPVLGHLQGRGRRQVVYLAPHRGSGIDPGQVAPRRPVLDADIDLGRRHLSAGRPRMARLAARPAAPRPAPAARARRGRRPVGRRARRKWRRTWRVPTQCGTDRNRPPTPTGSRHTVRQTEPGVPEQQLCWVVNYGSL